ncbi:hypothetical protein DIPPA_21662 [Diplonema papillatum]|nr:hypothetical protein DIPPA_30408 [Diplonema papillatum]KAJ9441592.1 hypothetical protein DIPPA_21662 [Diplonema papillatum]
MENQEIWAIAAVGVILLISVLYVVLKDSKEREKARKKWAERDKEQSDREAAAAPPAADPREPGSTGDAFNQTANSQGLQHTYTSHQGSRSRDHLSASNREGNPAHHDPEDAYRRENSQGGLNQTYNSRPSERSLARRSFQSAHKQQQQQQGEGGEESALGESRPRLESFTRLPVVFSPMAGLPGSTKPPGAPPETLEQYFLQNPDTVMTNAAGQTTTPRQLLEQPLEARPDITHAEYLERGQKLPDIAFDPRPYSDPSQYMRIFPEGVQGTELGHILPHAPPSWKPVLRRLPQLRSNASREVPDEQILGPINRGEPVRTKDYFVVKRLPGEALGPWAAPRLPAMGNLPAGDVDEETAGITRPHSDFAMATHAFATPTLDWQREEVERALLEEEYAEMVAREGPPEATHGDSMGNPNGTYYQV